MTRHSHAMGCPDGQAQGTSPRDASASLEGILPKFHFDSIKLVQREGQSRLCLSPGDRQDGAWWCPLSHRKMMSY